LEALDLSISYYLSFPLGEGSVEFKAASVYSSNDSTLDVCELGHELDDWKPKEWWDIGGYGSVADSV